MPRPRLYRPFNDILGPSSVSTEFYTNSTNFESFYVYTVPVNKLVNLNLKLTANYGGSNFAYFEYSGIFFNKGAGAAFRNGFHAQATDKTQNGFDVKALTIGNMVLMQAKSYTALPTHWEMVLLFSELDQ